MQHKFSLNPDGFKSSGRTSSIGSSGSYKLLTTHASTDTQKRYTLGVAQIFSIAANNCFSFLLPISAENGGQNICPSEFSITNTHWSEAGPGLPSYTCRKAQGEHRLDAWLPEYFNIAKLNDLSLN